MCYLALLSSRPLLGGILFGGSGTYLIFCHLPDRFELMLSRKREKLFKLSPLFTTGRVVVRKCDEKEVAWVVPMLLGMPTITAFMYWHINGGVGSG